LSATALVAAALVLRRVLRRHLHPAVLYALWLLAAARLLLPFTVGTSDLSLSAAASALPLVRQAEALLPVDTGSVLTPAVLESRPLPDSAPTEDDTPETAAVPWTKVVAAVWIGGSAVTLAWLLAVNGRCYARLRRSRRPLDAGRDLPCYVYVSAAIDTPCLLGQSIYVTPQVAADETALRHVLAHEATHYRHGDPLWAVVRGACLVVHWWNPLVWWAAKLSRQDGELACDEATIRALGEGERAAYGRTLIRMACGRGASPLLTATTMDGGKTSLHERIVLLAKKPRTAALAAIALVLAAALCVGCTFTGAKKNEVSADLGPIAAMMAELTVDDVADWDVKQYPNITLGRLVTAMNDAAAYEITDEEALGYEQDGQEWFVSVHISGGPYLMLDCGNVGGIVHVVNLSAAASSAYPVDQEIDAYFRHDTLYDLIRHAYEDGMTLRERMASVEPEDLGEISPYLYPQVTVQQLADALHMASSHKQITEAEAMAAGFSPMWRLQTDLNELVALCSSQEYIVSVQLGRGATGYFRDKTLYDLVRHSRDYDEFIDQASYEEFKPQIDAVMQQTLDNYATNPGKFTAYQLTRFTKVWQYATGDGNRADVYRFDYALVPEKPQEIGWAGGAYLDSQMRMQGLADCGNVVARYQGDTLLELVFMGNDNSYVPSFGEDWDWANGMLAAMEEAASAPTLTTETFSVQGLKVEVSNVCLTKKGTVREDESQVFGNDIFVVYPGAVLTVLEAPTFRDTDGVEHGDFLYCSYDGTQRLELWPGMTVEIEDGSAIVDESFGVLVFQMYSGM
jgi:beta-lactamase regulating signal transducer with metallopeptidase domain